MNHPTPICARVFAGVQLAESSPAHLLLRAISLIPFFYIIWMSFNHVGLIGGLSFKFIGLANWLFGPAM